MHEVEKIDRDEWLRRRRNYIGGSDAAAALGMSPYQTRLQLCKDKWGESADMPSAVMERGQVLEPVVAELYRRLTGHETAPGGWVTSEAYPWMAATPDLIDCAGHYQEPVQIKTASNWTRRKWDGGSYNGQKLPIKVPDQYTIQCQHELAVLGPAVPANNLAVLFADESAFRGMVYMAKGGMSPERIADHVEELMRAEERFAEFVIARIERDNEMISSIVEGERQFWFDYVLPHNYPPDASIPQKSDDILDATEEQTELLRRLRDAKRDENEAKERYAEVRAELETHIGEHSGIIAPGIATVKYRAPAPALTTNWAGVVRTLCEWHDRKMPDPDTWESLAKGMGLDYGDDEYNVAVEENTQTVQGPRVFRPRFSKGT